MKRILLNEKQILLLKENIGDDMRVSLALWCLLNDFRYIVKMEGPHARAHAANSLEIRKEICDEIMNAYPIVKTRDDGPLDDDSCEVYDLGEIEIEVDSEVNDLYGRDKVSEYENGSIDNDFVNDIVNSFIERYF